MKRIVCLLSIVLILVSCAPLAVSPVSVSTSPSPLLSTITSIPISTQTQIPKSISTIQTTTLLVNPSPTPTIMPTKLIPLLTAQAYWMNVCAGATEPDYEEDLSPDGNWIAVKCQDKSGFIGTKISRLDGTLSWQVPFYETYGKSLGMNVGEMHVVHWSKDGNYTYLVPYFCCADEPGNIFFNYFQDTLALYRLDLRTGKLTTTLQPFGNVFSGYSASLSPSSKYLTYVISNSPRDIHINDLQTGDAYTLTIDLQYIVSGNFEWSSDGTQAIFMGVKFGWGSETPISNGISYFLLDLKTKTSNHIFDQPDMDQVSWTQDGNIILHNVSGKDGLLYNLQNNTFTVVTPTPSP